MAWTNEYDTDAPDGDTQPGSVLDDQIKTTRKAIQERLNTDHYFPLTGTQVSSTSAGKHRKLTFYGVLTTKPTLLTGEGAVYMKTVSGVSELFYEDSAGTEKQLTSGGALNVAIAEILGILTNDVYFTGIDNAGTGTVNLIKARTDDTIELGAVATLQDASLLKTSAAPTTDAMIANKLYVDTSVAKYASSWASVSVAETKTYTHGLGTDAICCEVQFKDTDNDLSLGVNRIYRIISGRSESNEEGCEVQNITSTQLTIQVGSNAIIRTFTASGGTVTANSGQIRVLAWK